MVHLPPPVMCTVVPDTEQLPLAEKLTVRPDDAVALTVKSGSPKVLLDRAPKLMVWFALVMARLLGALDALLLLASPVVLVVPEYVPVPVGAVAEGP